MGLKGASQATTSSPCEHNSILLKFHSHSATHKKLSYNMLQRIRAGTKVLPMPFLCYVNICLKDPRKKTTLPAIEKGRSPVALASLSWRSLNGRIIKISWGKKFLLSPKGQQKLRHSTAGHLPYRDRVSSQEHPFPIILAFVWMSPAPSWSRSGSLPQILFFFFK